MRCGRGSINSTYLRYPFVENSTSEWCIAPSILLQFWDSPNVWGCQKVLVQLPFNPLCYPTIAYSDVRIVVTEEDVSSFELDIVMFMALCQYGMHGML